MKHLLFAALALPAAAAAQETPAPVTPATIVAAAPAGEWQAIDPADMLVMTLAPDAAGSPRTVMIQLMRAPFSQGWVGNMRLLVNAHWWDGTSVYRVVDNWVTQWGDGEDDSAKAKPLPEGLRVVPESEYVAPVDAGIAADVANEIIVRAIEADDPAARPGGTPLRVGTTRDPYSSATGYWSGWPLATDAQAVWPIHCYGYVGVARDLSPDTGSGAELYAVIGHAPRQLDRNIAVVGRVIEGIEHLSALPRGKGDAGVYDDARLRVPITSVRLGSDLPDPPRFEYLDTSGPSFARYLEVAANRSDPFYKVAAGGIDVCNAKVPIRRVPAP
jgi:peptidylprolyl isomerase